MKELRATISDRYIQLVTKRIIHSGIELKGVFRMILRYKVESDQITIKDYLSRSVYPIV